MTIITESLISECQSQKAICLNNILDRVHKKALKQVDSLNLPYDFSNKDVKKIIKHNLFIELCEFKKTISQNCNLYIKREEYSDFYLSIVDEITTKMELYRREKSIDFIKNLNKYLKKNDLTYLTKVYLKQVNNKLALFR